MPTVELFLCAGALRIDDENGRHEGWRHHDRDRHGGKTIIIKKREG
jgi:hypothetical protein